MKHAFISALPSTDIHIHRHKIVFHSGKIHVALDAHDQWGLQIDMRCNASKGPGSKENRLRDRAATLLRNNGSLSSPSILLPAG
jgi:hypothetical protein